MAYRDDKEAAYARADALQRELDRAQNELAQAKGKLADSERARDSLAKKLLDRNSPHVAPEPVAEPPRRRSGAAALGSLAVIGAISGLAVNRSHHYDYKPPPHIDLSRLDVPRLDLSKLDLATPPRLENPFTIDSTPSGASVYATAEGSKRLLGVTPLRLDAYDWGLPGGMGETLSLEADGYHRFVINDAPWNDASNAAHSLTYTLTPRKR